MLSACSSYDLANVPEFNLTDEEVEVHRLNFKKSSYTIYYLLMIDKEGKVVRVKIIDKDSSFASNSIAGRLGLKMIGKKATVYKLSENESKADYVIKPYGVRYYKRTKR